MVIEEASTSAPCPDCNNTLPRHIAEAYVHGGLRWDVEQACPICGLRTHEGGRGELEDPHRSDLIAAKGTATLNSCRW